jgi:hypothetical protein
MGELMEGAMQQAAQPGRQFMVGDGLVGRLRGSARAKKQAGGAAMALEWRLHGWGEYALVAAYF